MAKWNRKSKLVANSKKKKKVTAYEVVAKKLFLRLYRPGDQRVDFRKSDIDELAGDPEVLLANHGKPLSNPPAMVYEFRFRRMLPPEIQELADAGYSWTIRLAGKSRYAFRQVRGLYIEPRQDSVAVLIPNATPEIVEKYKFDDEQALLAKIRYNRLIDIFLGLAAFSLQNHLRTSASMAIVVEGEFSDGGRDDLVPAAVRKGERSQIEIDELYVGVDKVGRHYVIPVQAKGKKDKLSKAQTEQDILWCKERFNELECCPIAAQFEGDEIVLFRLADQEDDIRVVDERRYRLVPADEATPGTSG